MQSLNDTAQFGQPLQTPLIRVSGIDIALIDFIAQRMSVVRAHGNNGCFQALGASCRLLIQQYRHQSDQIVVSIEVVGFIKGAVRLARHIAQVYEVHPFAELGRNCAQVIVPARAQ